MLDFSSTRQRGSVSRDTAATTLITAEGAALVADLTVPNGVKPATGTAADQFVGVSIASQLNPTYLPSYEAITTSASGTAATAFPPIAGSLFIKDTVDNQVLTAAAVGTAQGSLTANQYAQTATGSQSFVVPAARSSHQLVVAYRYSPSVAAAQWLQGDQLPGSYISSLLSKVGVITSGDVYTSEFDTTVDWSAATLVITTGANGLFTVGGSGPAISNCRVISRPTAGNNFLGLSIGVNG